MPERAARSDSAARLRLRRTDAGAPAVRRQVPIIAVTAEAFNQDRRRRADAGMDDFPGRPPDREALIAVLRRWLPADRDRKPGA